MRLKGKTLKRLVIYLYLILALLSLQSSAWSQQYTWSGGSSGSWADPMQWTPNRVAPTVNDTMVIAGSSVTIFDVSTRTVNSLLIREHAHVTLKASGNATLTLTGAGEICLDVSADCSLELGTGVTLRSIGTVINRGGILGAGTLQCEGDVRGTADYALDVTFAGAGFRNLETTTSIVGKVTVASGTTVQGGASGASLDVRGMLTNNGTIRDNETRLTVNVNGSMVNDGLWENATTNLTGTGTLSGSRDLATSIGIGSSGDVTVTRSIAFHGEVMIESGGFLTIPSGVTMLTYNNVFLKSKVADTVASRSRTLQSRRLPDPAYARINGPGHLGFRGHGKTFSNEGLVGAATVFETNAGDVKSIVGSGGEWSFLKISSACNVRINGYQVFTGAPEPLVVDGSVTCSVYNTISYKGTAAQTISPLTYRRLEISNPAGATMSARVTILESVDILQGNLNTGSSTLTLSSSGRIDERGGSVIGNLKVARTCTTGINQDFGGVGIEINPQSYVPYPTKGQSLPSRAVRPAVFTVNVTRVTGLAPPVNGTTFVKKYYVLSTSGDGLGAQLAFRYRQDQLNETNESDLQLYESTNGGNTWIARGGIVDTVSKRITVSHIDGLNIWTAGHPNGIPPTLTSVSPQFGGLGEKLVLILKGTSFTRGSSTVALSGTGISVNSVTFVSATQLDVDISIAEGSAIGLRNVSVTTPAGSIKLTQGFEVRRPVPVLTSLTPASGMKGGALAVSIIGTGFVEGSTTVSFGDGVTLSTLGGNSTTLAAQIMIAQSTRSGPRNVTVVTPPPGGGSATLNGAFMVENPPPQIASISPSSAAKGSSVNAVITGSNFCTGATSLNLGTGITIDSVIVLNNDRLRARLSVSYEGLSTGARDVSVSNDAPGGGLATLKGAFAVTNPTPALTSIVPADAGRGGLVSVSVFGAKFMNGVTTLSFGPGIAVSTITVKSPTEMLVSLSISSVATPGPRVITVTNSSPGGGTATLLTGFTVSSDPVTGIDGSLGLVPDEYALQEAYPNPFNPSTRIRYGIPEDSRVELVIHNMLGNVVAQLINGARSKGVYELLWHAENLPSGVYLIRLQAESVESTKRFLASRKVVLVK